jgi:hypothetical protein
MVDGWDHEIAEKERMQQHQLEQESNFFNQWTPRYENPTTHLTTTQPNNFKSIEEQREEEAKRLQAEYEMKRQKQLEWSQEWEKNRVDKMVMQEEIKSQENQFLKSWIGVNGDGTVSENNMYVWRDPAEEVKKLGDDSEVRMYHKLKI